MSWSRWRLFKRSLMVACFDLLASWNPLAQLRARWFPSPAQAAWGLLNPAAELVIETTGSAASTSFHAYLAGHNPRLRVTGHWHMSWVIIWSVIRKRPTLFLWRERMAFLESMTGRYSHWQVQRWALCIRWVLIMGTVRLLKGRVLSVQYEQLKQSPADVVGSINKRFGLSLNPGNDRLPHIKTTSQQDHATLNKSLERSE